MKKSRYEYQKVAPAALRTSRDGILFHSKTEKDRYEYLRLLQMAKEIRNLKTQVPYALSSGSICVMAGDKPAKYTADFVYEEKMPVEEVRRPVAFQITGGDPESGYWVQVIEDVKGYPDENSRLRIRVFEALHGVRVRIVKRVKGAGWSSC
jgi:hypothetical protein